jgi:hypothetical protein
MQQTLKDAKSAQRRIPRRVLSTFLLLLSQALSAAAQTGPAIPKPVNAIQGVVSAFEQHPVVIIGEAHWLEQAGDFYVQLVRDKAFENTVQDIVVEFASRSNQELLDKYIAGEDVPMADVRRIWRDTTKVASWESPIYAKWLAAIREVNIGLPPSRRLRVLAGDSAIDWDRIHTHAEWTALGDNDVSIADVVMKEVLGRNHHALVVLGANHVKKSGSRGNADNTTARIESRYPGSTFVVLMDYRGLLGDAGQIAFQSSSDNSPMFYGLAGTAQGKVPDRNGMPLIKQADALLYLGPPDALTLALPAPGSLEPAYLEKIDRRSMIEWGELRARKFLGPAAH